jgi:hypothetical protein
MLAAQKLDYAQMVPSERSRAIRNFFMVVSWIGRWVVGWVGLSTSVSASQTHMVPSERSRAIRNFFMSCLGLASRPVDPESPVAFLIVRRRPPSKQRPRQELVPGKSFYWCRRNGGGHNELRIKKKGAPPTRR